MNDWIVETPTFEENLMNNRVVMLNQVGVNRVVEIIKEKDKEIERLNNIIKTKDDGIKAFTEDLCEENTKIEEAIEYIEKHTYHYTPKKLRNGIYERGILLMKSDFDIEDLLYILKGDDKE